MSIFLLQLLSWLMIGCGVLTFATLMLGKNPAAYGRYSKGGWGFMIESRMAWMTQEMWSALIPALMLVREMRAGNARDFSLPQILLFAMFLLHYTWRSFIYPWLARGGKPTPSLIWLMACVFCMYNGFLQAASILHGPEAGRKLQLHHVLGSLLWAAGWAVNLHSDSILRGLRGPGETGYKIPRGGAFEWVSGANYFGEIVEWTGFAVAAWSLPAAAFAIFTFCNVGPRGAHHHQWYRERFRDYPPRRRAVIPYVW